MATRFILLGNARSGSTLVAQAINAHPSVFMCDELFHPHLEERKGQLTDPNRILCSLDRFYNDSDDPVEFLQTHLYRRDYPQAVEAAGFKLFHEHARQQPGARLWKHLGDSPQCRVIHLIRPRLIESYVSEQIAWQTGIWEEPANGPSSTQSSRRGRHHVDIKAFKHYADSMIDYWESARILFARHEVLEIDYERDLVANFEETMRQIQRLLGIDVQPLPKKLKKQAKQPVEERAVNFAELRAALGGSRYERFL